MKTTKTLHVEFQLITVLLVLLFILPFFGGCTKNPDAEEPIDEKFEFSDKGFATSMSNIFGKPAGDITPEELSSIRYLYISYYDNSCNVFVGFDDYLAETDRDAKNALLKKTSVTSFSTFKDITYFTGLHEFSLYEIYNFSSIDYLKNCKELETLSISTEGKNKTLKSLDGIEKLKTLKNVNIYGAIITDVSKLGELTKLETLSIGADYRMYEDGDGCFSDISSFSSLKELKSLSINYSAVSDLSPLDGAKLEYLNVYRSGLSDISVIEKFTNLETVDLMYNAIEDVTPLTKLPKLSMMNLDYNYITDISPFASLDPEKITYISLDMNAIEDWTPVRKLYEAEKLNAGYDLYFND